jgi:hypothetical protein
MLGLDRKVLLTAATLALALSTTGCSSGLQDATFHFLVEPANGTFNGWTEITLGVDITTVGPATLAGCSLQLKPPATLPDLTFLSTLQGAADTGEMVTPVVSLDSFPPGQPSVALNLLYSGDLHPLFMDAHTIKLDWTGATNPAFTAWPTGGFWMEGDVEISVQ